MSDYDLQRFVLAQDAVFDKVLTELGRGQKRSHWMWFVFPQLSGLGRSAIAQRFALHSLDEARAYLVHPLLGERLRTCVRLVLASEGRSAQQIFGHPDVLKFHSSLTLFDSVDTDNGRLFGRALDRFYRGEPDRRTLEMLGNASA